MDQEVEQEDWEMETYRMATETVAEDTVANVIFGTEHNAPLAYAPGLELHNPIMSMLGGALRPVREIERHVLTGISNVLLTVLQYGSLVGLESISLPIIYSVKAYNNT